MLLTLLPVLLGFSIGKGKHRSYRRWKILGIVLGMAFFLSLITSFILQIQTMILPVGTLEILDLILGWGTHTTKFKIVMPIFSVVLTFFWFLVGMFIKWISSRRGL